MPKQTKMLDVTVPPATAADVISVTIQTQRRHDETGTVQMTIQSSGNPGARIVIQGRCSPEAPWYTLGTYDKSDMDDDDNATVVVSLMPEMRHLSLGDGIATYQTKSWQIE